MKSIDYLTPLIESFESKANPEIALQMGRYMRSLFPFMELNHLKDVRFTKSSQKQTALSQTQTKRKLFNCAGKPHSANINYLQWNYLAGQLKKNQRTSLTFMSI